MAPGADRPSHGLGRHPGPTPDTNAAYRTLRQGSNPKAGGGPGGSLGEATTSHGEGPPSEERWPPAHRYNRRVAAARDEPGGGTLGGSPEGTRHEARGVGHEASSLSSQIGLEPDQSKATPSDSCGGVAQGFGLAATLHRPVVRRCG